LHLVGFLLTMNYDTRNHELRKKKNNFKLLSCLTRVYAENQTTCKIKLNEHIINFKTAGEIFASIEIIQI